MIYIDGLDCDIYGGGGIVFTCHKKPPIVSELLMLGQYLIRDILRQKFVRANYCNQLLNALALKAIILEKLPH